MLQITGLPMGLDFTGEDLRRAAANELRLPERAVISARLLKKSVDARKKDRVHFVCSILIETDADEGRILGRARSPRVKPARAYRYELPSVPPPELPPVVAGFGPGGMFAGLLLAQCGQRPIIIERGRPVEERQKSVQAFWQQGILDPESNVQFGEGGAGAFSDGKLNTGTGDIRIRKVLEELAAAGAPMEILTDAKPHIGTDRLPGVVKNIRNRIIELGGQVLFNTKLTDIIAKDGHVQGIRVQAPDGERAIPCKNLILAVGHSARDVFKLLHEKGLPLAPKPFSVGVRIEHPAELIDRAQYGSFAGHPALGAADYKLSCHLKSGRGVYTFCMCPGGTVTGAASEPGGIVTNGMSPWARDGRNSNAALLVGVGPEDFGHDGPLAGVEYQRRIERLAYEYAGGYLAPAQRAADFLEGRASIGFSGVLPSYQPGVVPGDVSRCLPGYVSDSLREALPVLGRQLRGFDSGDAVLTAPETRSSSPVRVLRDDTLQSPGLRGLYPCGEGAGYAGGIVSAAVDGLRCGEAVMECGINR